MQRGLSETLIQDNAHKTVGRKSSIHGLGLFTVADIPQGEVILNITGSVVSTGSLPDAFTSAGHWQGIWPGWCLIADTPTKFSLINHSFNPNAWVDLRSMVVLAAVAIQANTEITVNYEDEPMDQRCRQLLGKLRA